MEYIRTDNSSRNSRHQRQVEIMFTSAWISHTPIDPSREKNLRLATALSDHGQQARGANYLQIPVGWVIWRRAPLEGASWQLRWAGVNFDTSNSPRIQTRFTSSPLSSCHLR